MMLFKYTLTWFIGVIIISLAFFYIKKICGFDFIVAQLISGTIWGYYIGKEYIKNKYNYK